jgi:predicted enzyme related to lactoylglutathione lyase
MSKLMGPDFISLQVRDLEASKLFYTKHLSLSPADRNPPGAVLFDTTPIPFAIRTPMIDLSASERLGWGVSIWLACDDADSFHERLKDAGVTILSPLQDGPFGRFFTFQDLDGYAVTLHTKTAHIAKGVNAIDKDQIPTRRWTAVDFDSSRVGEGRGNMTALRKGGN